MTTNLYVRPATKPDGTPARVRMPDRAWAVLPPEGANVTLSTYWARRLRDGDVVEAKPPVAKPAPSAEPEAVPATPEPDAPAKAGRSRSAT